jgi:peptidyl-prolyl cis-trans isomerase-like 4
MAAQSDGGTSIWGLLSGNPAEKTFTALFHPKLKHLERGTVSMATAPHPSDPDQRVAGSQFIVTLGDNTDYLDGKAAIFGKVVEGFDVLEKINDAIVDDRGHPLVDIRIKHTVVLDDPYPDPAGLREPSGSPPPTKAQLATVRIAEDEELLDEEANAEAAAEAEKRRREREAAAQALTLEMMGDLPFAEVKPPENVLFVCKLNPVTTDDDLELIFSRFGKILSCEVIRDQKTGDSLQYAFIEFEDQKSCEDAYSKMDSVLIDDRRIHVDFSQSVSRLSEVWRNETNTKRKSAARRGGGGWGGVRELEKRRQYRNQEDIEPADDRRYHMVHGVEDLRGRHGKEGDSARGGPSSRDPGGDEGGSRREERPPDRHGDSYRSGPDDRKRDAERRSRSPRRDRYRDGRHDRPADAGRSRDDREWPRRDRRDQDRDRGYAKDRDRYRGRDEYRGR